jgi:hypothetical protein
MQTSFTKQFKIVVETSDLVRLFRILTHLKDIDLDAQNVDIHNDALILLDELNDLHEVVQNLTDARSIKADLNVIATYVRNSDSISLGDIIIPGEKLPEVDPLDASVPPLGPPRPEPMSVPTLPISSH